MLGNFLRAAALTISVSASAGFLTGCASNNENFCGPPKINVAPTESSPGETIGISAGPVACKLQFSNNQKYRFELMTPTKGDIIPIGSTMVKSDGSFNYKVQLPYKLDSGVYAVSVSGSTLDLCIPKEADSCAMYSVLITIK